MKRLQCEMCGGLDLIKQEGVFICQHCGTKYSVEEAKKMMVEGVVKIDVSDELKNLYVLARRAKDEGNTENAQKYYEMIVLKDPSSWEATFYSVYYKSMNCRIAEIKTAADNVNTVVTTSLKLIHDNLETAQEKCAAITEIWERAFCISKMFIDASERHHNDIDPSIRGKYAFEAMGRMLAAEFIVDNNCNQLVNLFLNDADVFPAACVPVLKSRINNGAVKPAFVEAIKKYEPDYMPPKKEEPVNNSPAPQSASSSSGGCYVATAVYGSYDCPQVWTLRRYRDYTLAETWYGRAFIKMYYAISPTLVKWFGHTEWFKKMWKGKLDRMVDKLQANGVESTPYEDKNW